MSTDESGKSGLREYVDICALLAFISGYACHRIHWCKESLFLMGHFSESLHDLFTTWGRLGSGTHRKYSGTQDLYLTKAVHLKLQCVIVIFCLLHSSGWGDVWVGEGRDKPTTETCTSLHGTSHPVPSCNRHEYQGTVDIIWKPICQLLCYLKILWGLRE